MPGKQQIDWAAVNALMTKHEPTLASRLPKVVADFRGSIRVAIIPVNVSKCALTLFTLALDNGLREPGENPADDFDDSIRPRWRIVRHTKADFEYIQQFFDVLLKGIDGLSARMDANTHGVLYYRLYPQVWPFLKPKARVSKKDSNQKLVCPVL